MRLINKIIIHCSDSPLGRNDSAADIDAWHKAQGWNRIGYHYVVKLDGTIETGRPDAMSGAHCKGQNAHSIGICYIGGRAADGSAADTRTPEQKSTLTKLIYNLIQLYRCPVYGHHDFNPQKACPCFDALQEYAPLYRRVLFPDAVPLQQVIKLLQRRLK